MAELRCVVQGAHLAEQRKELHKEDVGKLWAARSDGKCVFVRIVNCNWAHWNCVEFAGG